MRFYHWLIWILTVRFILFWNYINNERLGSLSNDKTNYYLWSRFWLLMPSFIISRYCIISIFYSAQAIGMSWVKHINKHNTIYNTIFVFIVIYLSNECRFPVNMEKWTAFALKLPNMNEVSKVISGANIADRSKDKTFP